MQRRLSYAAAAGGASVSPGQGQATPTRSGSFAHIMNPSPAAPNYGHGQDSESQNPSAYQQHLDSNTHTGGSGGGGRIPYSWGKSGSVPSYWSQNSMVGAHVGSTLGANMFIRPSYLRGTRYLEKLEAVYSTKIAGQRDAVAAQSTSTPASLSASSSSVSLHRMAPSHRGMTYDIVENHPAWDDDTVPPLPSKWADVDRCGGLEVFSDGQDIRYLPGLKTHDHEAAAARTDFPMPPQCGIYYYEVTLLSKGKEGMIGVGFSSAKASLDKLPGWELESWAYHGDDGKSFCCQNTGVPYGPTFTAGDVVGCGINFMSGTAFFTKNGVFQGNAFKDLKDVKLYPSIGMKRPGAQVKVNFGQHPFKYDIDGMMAREKAAVRAEINSVDVTTLNSNLSEASLIKELVGQFLRHDGYVGTAKAFAEEVRAEAGALKKDPDTMLDSLEIQQDIDAMNRQQIRSAILDGDVDKALKYTKAYYPDVLRDNPRIYFHLRCRKFVEMMRLSTSPAPTPRTKALNGQGPQHSMTDDVFEQAMELDDPNGEGDDWDRMETEEANDRGLTGLQDRMEQTLKYAQELRLEYRDDKSREVADRLQEIFALFAYEDPKNSPTAHVMDPSGRAPVAEELNSAILVFLGKSSSAALERLCQQTEVLVSEISDHRGAGAFVNVTNDLLR